MSDEMDEIKKRNKAKQEELAKTYPPHPFLPCENRDCENVIPFENESEREKARIEGKLYCPECAAKRLET